MSWNENLTNLNYILAGLYPMANESLRIVDAAGLPKAHIAFQPKAIDNWHEILVEAERRGRIMAIITAARRDYPDDPFLSSAEKGTFTSVRGPILGESIPWKSQQTAFAFEKIIGKQSTLLPISFLEVGLQRARCVARVRLANDSLGSGFLIDDNIFVTNHHVLPNKDAADTAVIQFNYQQTATQLDLQPVDLQLAPDAGFATSPVAQHDYTLVRVQGDANADWGAIPLIPITVDVNDYVNIIQHPGGEPKQIALYHNVVAYADENRIQYLTDTQPGSSGSPVFDSEWRVVALHHSGGWILEPGTQKKVFRNEGININCIIQGLKQNKLT